MCVFCIRIIFKIRFFHILCVCVCVCVLNYTITITTATRPPRSYPFSLSLMYKFQPKTKSVILKIKSNKTKTTAIATLQPKQFSLFVWLRYITAVVVCSSCMRRSLLIFLISKQNPPKTFTFAIYMYSCILTLKEKKNSSYCSGNSYL